MSVIYWIIYKTTPEVPGGNGTEMFVNKLALAAGVCTIAAGISRSASGKSWLLLLNGLVLSVYGAMPLFWHGPLRFDFFALLLGVTAMAFGTRIGDRASPAASCRGRVAIWLGWGSVRRFCVGISRFGESLDSPRTPAFSSFSFSMALLVLWVQRNLHVGSGTPAAQIGPFPIQSMEPPGAIGKSKARALGLEQVARCKNASVPCKHLEA